jgi:hypothetical protein
MWLLTSVTGVQGLDQAIEGDQDNGNRDTVSSLLDVGGGVQCEKEVEIAVAGMKTWIIHCEK